MIYNLIRWVVFVQLMAFCSAQCDAAVIWTYDFKNLGPSGTGGSLGTSFTQVKSLDDGSVSFTASLLVTGSTDIGYLATSSGGIGVNGNNLDGNLGAESLRFSILVVHGPGVIVTFNGFTSLGLSNFGGNDLAVLSNDNDFSTTGDNFTVDSAGNISSTAVPGSPSEFTVFSVLDTQQFLVSSVTASFTGTTVAVPEPSAFLAIVLVASATSVLRRFRRRTNSVHSRPLF